MKKDRTLSQKLTLTVLNIWVLTVIYACIANIYGRDATGILLSVSGSLGIVLSGYFTKSFLENKEIHKQENKSELGC